ncbi:MAG TPA: transposase [Candidatus Dormibacteraeota bacterium]|jgi:transposase
MTILAERFVHVIGVDTHKRSLTAAVLNSVGGVLQSCEVPANAAGHAQLLTMAACYAGPVLWAIEGTGSYGAALTEQLVVAGHAVTEVDRPRRPTRKHGKSDQIDAVRAGREALTMKQLNRPRRRGEREELRVLEVTRAELVRTKTGLANHLQDLVVTSSETLRQRFLEFNPRSHASERLAKKCASARLSRRLTAEDQTRLRTMRDVSRLILELGGQADAYEREMKRLVEAMAPGLLGQPGLGTLTAAQVLVSWSHSGRIASEAAFASLARVAPIPASSGQTVRYRLNHGGDRKLNSALHLVVLNRCRYDQATRDYVARRSGEGKTQREIRRCLKRYLARQLFRFLSGLDKG